MFYTTRTTFITLSLVLNGKRIDMLRFLHNWFGDLRAAANTYQVALYARGEELHVKHLQHQLALAEDHARDTRIASREAAKARQEAEDALLQARLGLPTIDPSLLD